MGEDHDEAQGGGPSDRAPGDRPPAAAAGQPSVGRMCWDAHPMRANSLVRAAFGGRIIAM
jgi:hypothetical protein